MFAYAPKQDGSALGVHKGISGQIAQARQDFLEFSMSEAELLLESNRTEVFWTAERLLLLRRTECRSLVRKQHA